MNRDPISAEVRNLVDRALNGVLTEEDRRQLDAALLDNPQVQRFYLDLCQLHIDLTIDMRAGELLEEFRRRKDQIAPGLPAPIGRESRTGTVLTPGSKRPLSWSMYANVGLVAILIGIATYLWIGARDQKSYSANLTSPPATNTIDLPSVQILSGTTKLMLPRIGQVIVDGPAQFDMIGPMRARLSEGRIRVHVTEKTGHGFVVETPYGNVTDLGTEFGLDVPREGKAGLVVFNGEVDLEVNQDEKTLPSSDSPSRVKRLVQGDGVAFDRQGRLEPIGSVVTGSVATFQRTAEAVAGKQSPIIVEISDNRREPESKKFYEIVPQGLREDAPAYADRSHEWNGSTSAGMPPYLIDADYVKTFADDRVQKDLEIKITLSRPATLYLFLDKRLSPPAWLQRDFEVTEDVIGMDLDRRGKRKRVVDVGPGVSINAHFAVWKRIVEKAGVVTLGPPYDTGTNEGGMYGVAAVALPLEEGKVSSNR
jgi:hypothetical protein